jgi:hypothetical protein
MGTCASRTEGDGVDILPEIQGKPADELNIKIVLLGDVGYAYAASLRRCVQRTHCARTNAHASYTVLARHRLSSRSSPLCDFSVLFAFFVFCTEASSMCAIVSSIRNDPR